MATAVTPSAKRRVRKHTTSLGVELQPQLGTAVTRALKAGGSDIRFPALTGSEAAALMQAAGIVQKNGRLASKYR